jgi:hypothetical protein
MAIVLEIYRARLPEPEGRWYAVLSRNKKGAVHLQRDITDLLEERFQTELAQALKNHEMVWNERLEREKKAVDNLQIRYNRVVADKDAEASASARLIQEKEQEWQRKTEETIKRAREENARLIDNHLKTIHALQEEVRSKVSDVRKLSMTLHDERARVNKLLEITSDRDAEQVHLGRQEMKLKQGHLLHSELPWWKRWFRRPDPDLLPFNETSYENIMICRWIYSRILVDLRSRLK